MLAFHNITGSPQLDMALTLLGLVLLAVGIAYLWPLLCLWAKLRLHIVTTKGSSTRLYEWLTPEERKAMLAFINDSDTTRHYQINPVPLARTPAVLLEAAKRRLTRR